MKTHLIFLWFITFGVMACTSQPGGNTGENKVEGDTIPVLDFASAIHKQVPDTFMWNNVARKITYIPLASSHLMDGYPVIEYLDDDMCIINLSSIVLHSLVSYIRIFDNGSYKHIIYNKQGKFLREISLADSEFNYLLHMQGDTYFFRGSFSKGKSEIIVTDTTLRVKFPILPFDSTADYITRGAIMLNTTGEECAPDICLFNHIYSDSVFLLTPDGLKLDFILRKGKYAPSLEDVKQFMKWNQYDPFIKGLFIKTFPGYYYLQYTYKEQVLGEIWSRKTNQIVSRSILTRPNQFTTLRGIRFRFPSGTVIRLLPDYISGNKIAFFIPADEAMGEILGVKIREDDNPILMVMEL